MSDDAVDTTPPPAMPQVPPPPPSGYEWFSYVVQQMVEVRDSMTGEGGSLTVMSKSVDGLRKEIGKIHGDFTGLHNLASKTKRENDANWETLKHELSGLKIIVSNLAIAIATFDHKLEAVRKELKDEVESVRKEMAKEFAAVRGDANYLKQRVDMIEAGGGSMDSEEAVVR